MTYLTKDKKTIPQKKRTNWNQSLKNIRGKEAKSIKTKELEKPKKIKKSLQYLLILKKFNNFIDYKNIKLLRAFLTKYGKIRPRRKTRIKVQTQHLISKAIRKARAFKLIPFTIDVKI